MGSVSELWTKPSSDAGEARRRRALYAWFNEPLGQSLVCLENHRLRSILPGLYGQRALQVGAAGRFDLLESSPAAHRVLLDVPLTADTPAVCGYPEALPFPSRSLDLVLLPHTLDFADDPRQALREARRVLTPEGHLVLLGFNPHSLWGVRRLVSGRRDVPWCGHFIRLARIRDWLSLLELDWTGGQMLYYRPPVGREALRDRLRFMEHIGDRWWPLEAAVYLLVARRREAGAIKAPLRLRVSERLGVAGVPVGARRV